MRISFYKLIRIIKNLFHRYCDFFISFSLFLLLVFLLINRSLSSSGIALPVPNNTTAVTENL